MILGLEKIKKAAVGAVLTAVIVLSAISQVSAGSAVSDFTDVRSGAWYSEAVEYAIENDLMRGVSNTSFSPNSNITRGMLVTILYRLEKQPDASGASFNDIASGKYYTNAVSWASENGIVNGYENGNFGPNDIITREQLAIILYRYAAYCGADTGIYGEAVESGNKEFTDNGSISSYAKDAAAWASEHGYINGTDTGMFLPQSGATRAQAAQIIMNFCENTGK